MSEAVPEDRESLKSPFKGDINSETDLASAVEHMAAGRALAVDNDFVWALWGDGQQSSFVDEVKQVKDRETGSPFGLTVSFELFIPLLDFDRIEPSVRPLLDDPANLERRLGGLAFVRAPGSLIALGEELDVPDSIIGGKDPSLPVVQNYDPSGKRSVERLVDAAAERGIHYPVVTSFNEHGEREIVTADRAQELAEQHNLPVLQDRTAVHKALGSYAIVEFSEVGLSLVRHGNISLLLLRNLLDGYNLDVAADARDAAYKPYEGSSYLDLYGSDLREAMLEYFEWS